MINGAIFGEQSMNKKKKNHHFRGNKYRFISFIKTPFMQYLLSNYFAQLSEIS